MTHMVQLDERVKVRVGAGSQAGPGDLVLELPPPATHPLGCRCCGGRDPLAVALSAAFVARGRGARPWFDEVLVVGVAADRPRVAAVLAADPVALARFRAG